MDTGSVPSRTNFKVHLDEENQGRWLTVGISSVAISGETVTITLEAIILEGDEVITVSYTKPRTGIVALQGLGGEKVASFERKSVINGSKEEQLFSVHPENRTQKDFWLVI